MDLHEMERDFCSNFKCCHVKLSNLHALFDHLEACHPGSDISDLSFSVPCLGPSSTSEVMQIPAPPASLRKLKSLFTRVPLPPIPPISPIEPVSLCTSLSSIPQLSSASSSNSQNSQHPLTNSGPSSSASASAPAPRSEDSPARSILPQTPSTLTRDRIYTPVAIPWTLRPDPSQAFSWRVSAPTAFYPETAGYGYGYCYFPATPFIPHVPVPPAHARKAGVSSNVEVIDVDLIPSPQPSPRPSAAPLPNASASTFAPAPSPSVLSAGVSAPPVPAPSPPPSALCPLPSAPQSNASARDLLLQVGKGMITSVNNGSTLAAATPMEVVEIAANRDGAGCTQPSVAAAVPALQEDATLGGASGGDVVSHAPVDGGTMTARQITDAQDLKNDSGDATVEADTTPSPAIPTKAPRYLHGKEKTYVCPVPLCVKAYLNPGGLRYHALKGTCVKEDGTPCPTSLTISHDSVFSWPASAGATVSPGATTSEALSPAADSPSALLPPPRCRPARQSARLASSSAAKESAAAAKSATRGSVKTRSKAKSKLKTQLNTKTTTPKPKSSKAIACSPSSIASSPLSSHSYNSDFDSDDSDADLSGDD
ncbi:C2H2-type domain-containing protein [Mycena sanguinolenta]|uniref:C2H2-type domain-containing protein n=1 Tax=Mycena sanguinolenta TaxID=230812 RepID=A0A8H7DJ94_9AGAR|nr:C2H2-type domain-containing protein [Mycena sanguinolenta]